MLYTGLAIWLQPLSVRYVIHSSLLQHQPAPAIKSVYNSRKWWLGLRRCSPLRAKGVAHISRTVYNDAKKGTQELFIYFLYIRLANLCMWQWQWLVTLRWKTKELVAWEGGGGGGGGSVCSPSGHEWQQYTSLHLVLPHTYELETYWAAQKKKPVLLIVTGFANPIALHVPLTFPLTGEHAEYGTLPCKQRPHTFPTTREKLPSKQRHIHFPINGGKRQCK